MRATAISIATCAALTASASMAADPERFHDPEPFAEIVISDGVHAYVAESPTFALRTEADTTAALDAISVSIEQGTLHVAVTDLPFWRWLLRGGPLDLLLTPQAEQRVFIGAPPLPNATARDGATILFGSLSPDTAQITAEDGAEITAFNVDVGELALIANDGAKIWLRGGCEAVSLQFSAGAEIDAADLACFDAAVDGNSGAHAEISAARAITGRISEGASLALTLEPMQIELEQDSGATLQRP